MKEASPRKIIGFWVAVLIGFLLLLVYNFGPPEMWNYFFRKTWGQMFEAKGRRQICAALSKYYREHGEYPAYLLGGDNTPPESGLLADFERDWVSHGYYGDAVEEGLIRARLVVENLSDPLLQEGFLRRYPSWPYAGVYRKNVHTYVPDPRGLQRIRNIVSSPSDPIVEYYLALTRPVLEARLESGEFQRSNEPVKYYAERGLLETALRRSRVYCGGVYKKVWQGAYSVSKGLNRTDVKAGEGMQASAFSAPFFWGLNLVGGPEIRYDLNNVAGQFGYQRGDTIEALEGGTPQEAWLWFYGEVPRYQVLPGELFGLDLVDNANGLIQPDGIPDGIVLLYKLKDGKTIEVVKDYD